LIDIFNLQYSNKSIAVDKRGGDEVPSVTNFRPKSFLPLCLNEGVGDFFGTSMAVSSLQPSYPGLYGVECNDLAPQTSFQARD
jgi:hypothetical protein